MDKNRTSITYVLGQIKISPLLSIKSYVPQLQEAIRHEFPNYKETNMQRLEVKPSLAQPEIHTFAQWHFFDIEATTGILLETDSIIIHSSDYKNFKSLIDSLQGVLIKFQEILKISGYTRIGLRYIDVIKENIGEILKPELRGFHVKDNPIFKENKFFAKTETMQETTIGFIKIQSTYLNESFIQNNSNNLVPVDLVQTAEYLSFDHIKQPVSKFIILDIDHFSPNKKEEFNVNKIIEEFKKLNVGATEAFNSSRNENAQ